MKTNELNNGIKEVYTKPALEVEEMEVQWNYLTTAGGGSTTGTNSCTNVSCTNAECSDAECAGAFSVCEGGVEFAC